MLASNSELQSDHPHGASKSDMPRLFLTRFCCSQGLHGCQAHKQHRVRDLPGASRGGEGELQGGYSDAAAKRQRRGYQQECEHVDGVDKQLETIPVSCQFVVCFQC